jgi:biopolymer transport protein ExbD
MAQLQLQPASLGKRKGRKYLPAIPRIDMTPMVDLGFLLITFFIVTTTLAESKTTDLFMPKDGPPIDVKESAALTIILGDNEKVYTYSGRWEEALARQQVQEISFSGIGLLRSVIQSKQAALGKQKDDLMVLIKSTEESNYSHVIDAIDEMIIHQVKRYAIVNITPGETAYVKSVAEKRK